jgi:aryl-alcohol dehydrogenase-like predicted oxidoreductase
MKSLAASDRYGYPRYAAHQAYYSLLNRDYEWELLQLGRDQGVGALIWSPLGWGKLTGKIRRGQAPQPGTRAHAIPETGPQYDQERLFAIVDALDGVAAETGKTVPQIALNWLLRRPTVSSVIIGARNEEQLVQNIGAVGWKLTPEQVAKLDAASDVLPAYPVWHQRGSPMLNERAAEG